MNFEWNRDVLPGITPQTRRYRKALGDRTMTLGPLTIMHGRELTEEEQRQVAYTAAIIQVDEDISSLQVLKKKE